MKEVSSASDFDVTFPFQSASSAKTVFGKLVTIWDMIEGFEFFIP